ncbi:hypothetical protein Vafri_3990, partial [Volvox africanus]
VTTLLVLVLVLVVLVVLVEYSRRNTTEVPVRVGLLWPPVIALLPRPILVLVLDLVLVLLVACQRALHPTWQRGRLSREVHAGLGSCVACARQRGGTLRPPTAPRKLQSYATAFWPHPSLHGTCCTA